MADSNLHEAVFDWYHPEATKVVITGTFDNWSGSVPLGRIADGFETKLMLPWGTKVLYKYIVDSVWTYDPTKPTEPDHKGNINNIYYCPPKPDTLSPAMSSSPSQHAAKAPEPVSTIAQPLVEAADAMPPTTAQAVYDQAAATATAATQQAKDAINGLLETQPASTAVDLHPSETPAAPLLEAADAMPSTSAQKAYDIGKSAVVTVVEGSPSTDAPPKSEPVDKALDTSPPVETPKPELPAPPKTDPIVLAAEPTVAAPTASPSADEKPAAKTEFPASTHTPVTIHVQPPSTPSKPAEKAKVATPPTTPKKAFPSVETDEPSSAHSSPSKGSTRKKRTSIFGKLKEVFHLDKDKEKEKKSSPLH